MTPEIRNAPFLLAYTLHDNAEKKSESGEDKGTYHLMKASDIFIIDNSFFGRMFPVPRAPQESDLEDFYVLLGSNYISKSVVRRFEVVGKPNNMTDLTKVLMERILERAPLLVSPNVTSRPLVADAPSVLTPQRLTIFEASNLMAVYSLNGVVRQNKVTCFSRELGGNKNAIYVIQDFDWYDCGFAVGDLILRRCQLEDAFYISSLLEAPVEQLRARGFPVDRIIKTEPPMPPPIKTEIKLDSPPSVSENGAGPIVNGHVKDSSVSNQAHRPGTIVVDIPQKPSISPEETPPQLPAQAQKQAPPPITSNSTHSAEAPSIEGFDDILKQMYPDASMKYIKNRLGSDPNLDNVQSLAEEMFNGKYPKEGEEDSIATDEASRKLGRKKGLRSKLGKAFSGLRPSNFGGMPSLDHHGRGQQLHHHHQQQQSMVDSGGAGSTVNPPVGGGATLQDRSKPVPPTTDATSYSNLERMLKNTVQQSADVNKRGIQSQDSTITSIPEGLDRGDKCEIIPGHSLKPFPGPRGNGMTHNGIRLFSASHHPQSEEFMTRNVACVDSFGIVLERLCSVYDLKLSSIAIFHDPTGGTIAFNAGRALHFNLRFFHALHFTQNKQFSPECYCYWYVTIAHELAHHMVSAHNKEHGFYTESYVTTFLPKLTTFLAGDGSKY